MTTEENHASDVMRVIAQDSKRADFRRQVTAVQMQRHGCNPETISNDEVDAQEQSKTVCSHCLGASIGNLQSELAHSQARSKQGAKAPQHD